jgi:hypothetical protein
MGRGAKRQAGSGCDVTHSKLSSTSSEAPMSAHISLYSNKQTISSATAGGAHARAPLAAPPPRHAPVVAELHAGKFGGKMSLEKKARSVLQIELPRRDDVEVCDGAQSSNSCARVRTERREGEGWRGAAPSTAPLTTGCEK